MEFRLFGEVRLGAGDQFLDSGTPRQQAVIAALAVEAGRPVPIETLIDRIWGENPPVEVRNVLYSHLSRIRQLLRRAGGISGVPAGLARRPAGYVLEVDPDLVDLHRFTRLVESGKDVARSVADRDAALTEALRLWYGPPLAGITGDWADQVRATWHRRRLDAAVHWAELRLRLGRTTEVIEAIADLATEYPLAEPLEALLMRALHAAGRVAEAIDRYAVIRQRLADELGTDPGPQLRALYVALLRGDPPAIPRLADPPSRRAAPTTPAQLPPDTGAFAGRAAILAQLDGFLADPAGAARIVVLSGTAGIGKTTVAVHWAHRVRSEFPGGQLYVNLRGFDPTGTPVTSAEALRGFLEALEVPAGRIPTSFEAQVGLYRSLLADRRVLVLLDNARDAEQVRPLLPGSPGCVVLVTSRDQLVGLVTTGAHPIPLDLLDHDEAAAVLRGRIGAARVAAEPAAAGEIIDLCARLPLALAVVAARAATNPRFGLAALAEQLRGGLDEFAGADPATDPRAVFSWSYLRLSAPAARLFRLFGLHPGPAIGGRATASLAGVAPAAVRPWLAELTGAHLIDEPSPGRYTCHDLLRAYAAELAHQHDPAAERDEAARRLLGHYAHTAYHADGFLDPRREVPPAMTPLPPGAESERILDHAHALAWFTTEHRVLLALLPQPASFDQQVWDLAWTMRRFLALQAHWQDQLTALSTALDAARRLADLPKQAYARCYLGCTHIRFDRYEEAGTELWAALNLYVSTGDRIGQAYVHHYLSWLLERQAKLVDARAHAEQALDLFRDAEHQAGEAMVLNAIGWFLALLNEPARAVPYCQQALDLQIQLGDHLKAGQTWHSLGYAYAHLGSQDRAMACYEKAVELFHRHGYLVNEAHMLIALADAKRDTGDPTSARARWRQAYDILSRLNHPDAESVRAKLTEQDRTQ